MLQQNELTKLRVLADKIKISLIEFFEKSYSQKIEDIFHHALDVQDPDTLTIYYIFGNVEKLFPTKKDQKNVKDIFVQMGYVDPRQGQKPPENSPMVFKY